MRSGGWLVLAVVVGWVGFGMSFYGNWDFTLELLPRLRVYESELTLNYVFAPGWRVESESKFYFDGLRYQNFYLDGTFGEFDVWGKMYFHAQGVRYQKMWVNAELPLGAGEFRISFNHWATRSDYSSYDVDKFGPWPCYVLVPAAPVIEAMDLVVTWTGSTDPRIGQRYYVHGTIVAYYPLNPTTYVNLYLVRNSPHKRFIVYIRFADFEPDITLDDVLGRLRVGSLSEVLGKEICAFGTLVDYRGNPEIILANSPHQLADLNPGACVPETIKVPASGPYINWRYTVSFWPLKLTADFSDCCAGTWFRQLKLELSNISLCCGLFADASLIFTKADGFEKLSLTIGEIPLPCCGVTTTISLDLTPTSKIVQLKSKWGGLAGCFAVYGDVNWGNNVLQGIEISGWDISCYVGDVKLRFITALNPDEVEDITDITFYSGEREYVALTYTGRGCCGGDVALTLESWFGDEALLFGFQRFKFSFEVPLTSAVTVFTKAQWDFSDPTPLDWFDVGWKVSF